MKKRVLLLLSAPLFTALTASAQSSWLWGRQGVGGMKTELEEFNVATNKTGNVYDVGDYETMIQFGQYNITYEGGQYLVKYDQNGNVLWAINTDLGGDQNSCFVASDDSDNAYVTGYANYSVFGTDTLKGAVLVKFNPNGNVVWAKQFDTTGIYYTGVCVTTDNFEHEYAVGFGKFCIVKFDRNGNVIWNVTPKKSFNNFGYTSIVTTDIYGNVYVSGAFQDSLAFGTHQLYSVNGDIFIAKLDSNGNVLWAQQSSNNNSLYYNDDTYSVTTDRAGAVYLTGVFWGTVTFNSYTLTTGNSNGNLVVIKFNPGGSIAWGKAATFNGNDASDDGFGGFSTCSDDSNHIYVTGGTWGDSNSPVESFSFSNDTIGVGYYGAHFLLKLDTTGRVLCDSTLTGASGMTYVASDPTGRFVYLGGSFGTMVTVGPDYLIDNTGGPDPFVARWQPCDACDLVVTDSSQSLSICAGQSVSLAAQGGTGYNWSPSTGLNATTGNNVVATPSVTTTYTISSSAGTCLDTARVVVTVITPHVQVAPPSSTICTYQGAILVASGATNYEWYPSTGLNTTTGDSVIANPTVNTTYTVIGSNGNCSDSAQTYINLIPAPNIPTITVSVTGDSLISSAISNNQWYFDNVLIPDSTRQVLVIKGHAKGWYYVTVTNQANGCSTTSDSTTSVNQLSIISEQLSVYPNPTSNTVFVKISSAALNVKDWSLQFTDVLGRTLYTKSSLNYNNEIDLSALAGGMYFIAVVNKTGRAVFKVVKEN